MASRIAEAWERRLISLSIAMRLHIISDGWSLDVLRQELGQLYAAAIQGKTLCLIWSRCPFNTRSILCVLAKTALSRWPKPFPN